MSDVPSETEVPSESDEARSDSPLEPDRYDSEEGEHEGAAGALERPSVAVAAAEGVVPEAVAVGVPVAAEAMVAAEAAAEAAEAEAANEPADEATADEATVEADEAVSEAAVVAEAATLQPRIVPRLKISDVFGRFGRFERFRAF